MIGETIGRYRVVEKLGEGGMGVVYKARDTLLGRFVALKALPSEKGTDSERRQRFIDEAKAASALQHPGIVSVYDVVQADGQDLIVMEFVAGETLEQRMGRRALPLGRGLRYGEQIADALARAHAAGIIHRDLKPSNVMVTEDDAAKVLDFGLAKLAEAPFSGSETPTVSEGEAEHATREGAIAGTLAYMSPEQSAGRPVDSRTDVFSFGVLLYEMLTGRHPFRRGSRLETLSAIREAEPERPTLLAPGLPPEAERAILRCLHKEPSRRWQSMADLSSVLRDLREDSESGPAKGGSASRAKHSRAWLWASGPVLVAVAAAAILLYPRLTSRPAQGPIELAPLTFDTGMTAQPTISADGTLVAYASDRGGEGDLDIWVQHVNDPRPARLTRHPANDNLPSLSPDGSRVAFRSERDGGGLYVVGTVGGEERKIADHGTLPSFSPDGSWIAYVDDAAWVGPFSKMFLVPAGGGTPRPFQPDYRLGPYPANLGPVWSPDGRFLLFAGAKVGDQGRQDWWVASVEGGPAVPTGAFAALRQDEAQMQFPCAWVGRHLVMVSGSQSEGINLYRVRIAPGDFRVSGPPEPLTSGMGMTFEASVARDGRFVMSRYDWKSQIGAIDRKPPGGPAAPTPQALTHDGAPKSDPFFSRGVARVVYSAFAGRPGQRRTELRVRDLPQGEETVAVQASGQSVHIFPHVSPDGTLLSWLDRVDKQWVTFVGRAGDSTGREICRNCRVFGFFSDPRRVLATVGPSRLVRRDVESGAETPLLEPAQGVYDADLSWDDRWVAVGMLRPDGSTALQVVPVGERAVPAAEWVAIADSQHLRSGPRWAPEGDHLYYIAKRDGFHCVWAQALDSATKKPRGTPVAVFHAHRNPWRMTSPPWGYSLAVGRRQIVFNAGEITGNVLMGQLPPE